ncbi:class I SAM-dependent methyltransferase family protein [Candidatus Woesearchaeota archaeon]|nr:class I SAM-dependent methyltransferase family protein [Candidatus Woesearchaeota archaeon]
MINTNHKKSIKRVQNYKELLIKKLDKKDFDLLPSSFDITGEIVVLEIKPELIRYEKEVAKAILKTYKNIRTVLKKTGVHEGEFRTQKLKYLAGKKTKETIYKENNIRLKLNVEKVYFSPRLSTERKRIYEQIKPNEIILVMFSGVGPYPIVISKNTKATEIYAIEKNKIAHKYAKENLELNKIKNIKLFLGDVRKIVPKLKIKFDRILMPLPRGAEDFIDLAISVSKKGSIIHFYDFEHETEFHLAEEKVKKACKKNKIKFKIINLVKCGQYSPGKYRLCVDFEIK